LETALDYWIYHHTIFSRSTTAAATTHGDTPSNNPTCQLPPLLVESRVWQARRPSRVATPTSATAPTPLIISSEDTATSAQVEEEEDREDAQQQPTTPSSPVVANQTDETDPVDTAKVNDSSITMAAAAASVVVVAATAKTRQEEQLEALELELAQVQQDCNDEASNYMRSKQEVKDLQRRFKQLTKQVQGLRRKVEAQRRQREEEELKKTKEQGAHEEADKEDEEGQTGVIDLFGNAKDDDEEGEDNVESTPVKTTSATNDDEDSAKTGTAFDLELPEETIAKGWTGKSPRDLLEERCRKLQIPRPTFQKLGPTSCRITVKIGSTTTTRTPVSNGNGDTTTEHLLRLEYHGKYSIGKKKMVSVNNYLATKAMYQMDSKLPIYNNLPPFFRDLWKTWLKEAELEQTEAQLAQDKERQDDILRLLSLTESGPNSSISSKPTNDKTAENPLTSSPAVDSESDNEYNFDDIPLQTRKSASPVSTPQQKAHSAQLKHEFNARTSKQRYQSMLQQRRNLPIFAYREQILDMVSNSAVTVLHAETGAGKTTQCPQFLLEEALRSDSGSQTSIICTQPRRVAATSVAERVAEEMDTKLGGQVGYQIRLEAKRTKDTKLLFCTTGVILRLLIENPTLDGISHVVVDEVHERQWQIDVLLVALRNLIALDGPRRNNLKVILMSATLDAELFCSFFGGAPILSVPGRTFPVSNYYLEDLIEATGHVVEEGSRNALREYYGSHRETASMFVTTKGGEKRRENVSLDSQVDVEVSDDFPDYSISTRKSLDRVDETVINYELIEEILHYLLISPKGAAGAQPLLTPDGKELIENNGGAVLVFMPGIGEIRTLIDRLQSSKNFQDRKRFDIIPMHSALSSSEQRRAFVVPRKVKWAIIVATNVAETSVTIPDAVCVLDSGRVREIRHDKRTLTRRLVTTWTSRASTKQRAGRAGRVRPGLCLRLFSSKTESNKMQSATEPELQRLPLEEVCLTILAGQLSPNGCLSFLMQTPQPPKHSAVEGALLSLVQVGAISIPAGDSCEELTALGSQLAKLPVDCRLGKMLLWSVWLRCVDRITTVVAALSASQSLFLSTLRDANVAKAKQATFRDEKSDFSTLVAVYNSFSAAKDPYAFCREHYLSYVALREISDARTHYQDLLRGWRRPNIDWNENNMDDNILLSVVAAGLSPQVARIDRLAGGQKTELWYRPTLFGTSNAVSQEQLVSLHNSSGLKLPKGPLPSRWLLFFEKFGVQQYGGSSKRLSVRTVAYVPSIVLSLVVGRDVSIRHLERRILIDGWMSIPIAAQSAILLRAIRELINRLDGTESNNDMLKALVHLLHEATSSS